jgi:hypothetical protein
VCAVKPTMHSEGMHYRRSTDFLLPEATKNKGKPIKNKVFLVVINYFRWYLTAENILVNIKSIFSGIRLK